MGCEIMGAPGFGCDDRKNSAGLQNFGYVANKADVTFVKTGNLITAMTFVATKVLYKFEVPKQANDSGYEIQTADGTGNPSYKFMINAQFSASDQTSLDVIDDLVFATDLVYILPTQGKIINVFGVNGGVSIESGTQNSGKTGADNNLHQLTFSGEDNDIFAQFLDTDYDTSIATLEGYLTV